MKQYTTHRVKALLTEQGDPNCLHQLPALQFRAWQERQFYQARKTKKLVYLDLNFWINFRDVLLASLIDPFRLNPRQQSYLTVHSLLARLVKKERISCLLSSSLLEEMAKMSKEWQFLTARVMDGLQCRMVLNNYRIAMGELVNISNVLAGRLSFREYYLSSIFEANPRLSERFF